MFSLWRVIQDMLYIHFSASFSGCFYYTQLDVKFCECWNSRSAVSVVMTINLWSWSLEPYTLHQSDRQNIQPSDGPTTACVILINKPTGSFLSALLNGRVFWLQVDLDNVQRTTSCPENVLVKWDIFQCLFALWASRGRSLVFTKWRDPPHGQSSEELCSFYPE